jgi:hypothetical protein
MSESPAGARLNFAMRGDVRASPIESVGAVVACQQGPIADRDERYGGPSASRPILQAWRNTVDPSASICSLKRRLGATLTEIVALRTSSGSRGRSMRSMMHERECRRAACNCWHQVLGCEPNESVNADKCVSGPGARCPVYKNDVPFSDGAVIGSMLRPY